MPAGACPLNTLLPYASGRWLLFFSRLVDCGIIITRCEVNQQTRIVAANYFKVVYLSRFLGTLDCIFL